MTKDIEEISIEEEIKSAMSEVEGLVDEPEEVTDAPEDVVTDEVADIPEVKPEPYDEAPVSLSAAIKEKWKELPADVRAEWFKREQDMHRNMTAKDGDLNFGRTIKEIAQPYEAIIRAEGGTVDGAFKDLMNTAYVLRTGSPDQKAHLILNTAQQFGVDLRPYLTGQQPNNQIAQLQNEIHQLRQLADPNRIKSQLQEDMDNAKIQGEIQAFASDSANVHFEAVKPIMGALLHAGKAKNLKEAYEMAIWSDPSIRATLEAKAKAEAKEKQQAENVAKKKAAASVAGSSVASPNANAPKLSLEDEIREQMRASQGKI